MFRVLGLIATLFFVYLGSHCFAQNREGTIRQQAEFAESSGTIKGAIWRYQMEPVVRAAGRDRKIMGQFRVFDLEVFQSESIGGEMKVKVGKSEPNLETKATKLTFTALKGVYGPKQPIEPMKGSALMHLQKFGVLKGKFIDEDGHYWKMGMKRVQE